MCRNLYWILEDWKCLRANGCLRTASQKLLFSCAMDMPWSAVSPWKVYIYIYAYRIRTISISVRFRVCCKFVVSTDSKLKSILKKGQKRDSRILWFDYFNGWFFFFGRNRYRSSVGESRVRRPRDGLRRSWKVIWTRRLCS